MHETLALAVDAPMQQDIQTAVISYVSPTTAIGLNRRPPSVHKM